MKLAIGFLGGTVFATLIVVFAGGRSSGMIALGFLLTVSVLAAALKLAGLRRVARFLDALSDAFETSAPLARTKQSASLRTFEKSAKASAYVKPSKRQQLHILADTVDEYRSEETKDFLNDPELFGQGKVA